MTTNTFTKAAMAHLAAVDHDKNQDWFNGFVAAIAWARTHLATQEPTEAEVRAVKIALIQYEYRVVPGNELTMIRHLGREDEYDKRARAALSAARDARLNGEKR